MPTTKKSEITMTRISIKDDISKMELELQEIRTISSNVTEEGNRKVAELNRRVNELMNQ